MEHALINPTMDVWMHGWSKTSLFLVHVYKLRKVANHWLECCRSTWYLYYPREQASAWPPENVVHVCKRRELGSSATPSLRIKDVPRRHLLGGGLEGGSKFAYQKPKEFIGFWHAPSPAQSGIPFSLASTLFYGNSTPSCSTFSTFWPPHPRASPNRGGALTIHDRNNCAFIHHHSSFNHS